MIVLRNRTRGAQILALVQGVKRLFPGMNAMRWYNLSRHLAELQYESEEARLAGVAQTDTTELAALPRLSARWWLEDEQPALAPAEEPERNTDADVEISPRITRKLSTEHFIETEKRAAICLPDAQ